MDTPKPQIPVYEYETPWTDLGDNTWRMVVPGGYLYRYKDSMLLVPWAERVQAPPEPSDG